MRSLPLSLTLACSLVCGSLTLPLSAHAGQLGMAPEEGAELEAPAEGEAPPEGAEAPADEDPALTEARDLYKQGEISFQTGEFNAALSLWKRAFAILPDGDDTRAIRHALVYNIAEAHSRAYEVSRNPTHLRTAKVMLETYRKDHLVLYGEEPEAVRERAEVDDRIAELDKKIEASVAAGEQAAPLEEGAGASAGTSSSKPAPAPKPLTPQQQWEKEVKADPVLGPQWDKANKRVVGGAVLTGIGVPFVGIGLALFVSAAGAQRVANETVDDPLNPVDDFAGAGAGLLWVGGGVSTVIGLGMLIPGAILLGKGLSDRKQVLAAKPKPVSSFAPSFSPRGASFNYTLRF